FPLFSIAILGHSFLDFDMSFVYMSSIVFLTLGVSVASSTKPSHWLQSLSEKKVYRSIGKLFSGLLLIISIVIIFRMSLAQQADTQFTIARKIASETGNYNQFKPHLDKLIELRPMHPEYNVFEASVNLQLYRQTQDIKYDLELQDTFNRLNNRERYNRNI